MSHVTIRIDRRFQGPPDSGNGGYVAGRLAAFVDGTVRVRLHRPPPLETELEVCRTEAGVRLLDDGAIVAEARSTHFRVELPPEPDFEAAELVARDYRGFHRHWFPRCFVCGPERDPGDGLRIFSGPISKGGMIAAPWVPDATLGDEVGRVRSEFVWSALDCPGVYSFPEPSCSAVLMGEQSVQLSAPVEVNERCVIVGWQLSHEGRKHVTATALHTEACGWCAVGLATWLEIAR